MLDILSRALYNENVLFYYLIRGMNMGFEFKCWTDGVRESYRWEANTSLYGKRQKARHL